MKHQPARLTHLLRAGLIYLFALAAANYSIGQARCFNPFDRPQPNQPHALEPSAVEATTSSSTDPCPQLAVLASVSMKHSASPDHYLVVVSWQTGQPQCFTIESYQVKGVVTFSSGQTRTFDQTTPAIGSSCKISVGGPPVENESGLPRVDCSVIARATAPAAGSTAGSLEAAPCTLLIPIQITRAVFDGLAAASDRRGHDGNNGFPKVRVEWKPDNLPKCILIDQFAVTVRIRADGKVHEKNVTVAGTERSAVVVVDSVAVDPRFVPDSVEAVVKATGKAVITGHDDRSASFEPTAR